MHSSSKPAPFLRLLVGSVGATASMLVAAGLMAGSPVAAEELPPSEPAKTPAAPTEPCLARPANVRRKYWNKVPKSTQQVVVVEGRGMESFSSRVIRWEKQNRCWVKLSSYESFNGYRGWAVVPWSGGLRSPIGTYRLTDAGGRLRNPGTKMPYHYGPQAYGAGGYAMSKAKLQIFDYVVAINYNRKAGTSPRANRVLKKGKASGYWFHVCRMAPTRGCISMSRPKMKILTSWLDPSKKPVTIQGPKSEIYR